MRMGFVSSMVLCTLATLCACDEGDEVTPLPPDAAVWGPVAYKAQVYPRDTLGTLRARIDGVLTEVRSLQFIDAVSFANARIHVELLDGNDIVDSLVLDPATDSAGCQYAGGNAEIKHEICGYDHGELRLGAIDVRQNGGGCIGDWFCLSRCDQTPCDAGTKCGSSFAAADLRFSRLQCVPAGDRLTGDTCTWRADTDGRWIDDCVAGSMCVSGVCRAQCLDGACPSGSTCTRIPGHSAEIPACVASVLRE